MRKCPYCGYENDERNENCSRCKAGIPRESAESNTPDEQETIRSTKRKLKESE